MRDSWRHFLAEFIGTFALVFVGGASIMLAKDSSSPAGLLEIALAHGLILAVMVSAFMRISGHFNPAVTLVMALAGNLPWREVPAYLAAQFAGAFAGVGAAHLMFGMRLFFASTHARHGSAQLWSEAVATFGLLFVIRGCSRLRPSATAYAVGAYITAAY